MNTAIISTGVLSCLLLLLTMTHAYILPVKHLDDDQQSLIEKPFVGLAHHFLPIYQDDGAMFRNSNEHELEKRRFNAWAGKRSAFSKRRFNAWAGR